MEHLLSQIEEQIKPQGSWRMLDVGCGPLPKSRFFERGQKYGIDPILDVDRSMRDSVCFVQGTAEAEPFRRRCFDVVVCTNVLDHTWSPMAAIREIEEVLKGTGYVLIDINVRNPLVVRIQRFVEKLGLPMKEKYHPHFFTVQDLKDLCREHFELSQEYVLERNRFRDSKLSVLDTIRTRNVGRLLHILFRFVQDILGWLKYDWSHMRYAVLLRKN